MLLFGILLSLLLSALFSGTEIAFISASKLMVELKRKKGTRRGQILATFYNKPAEFIGTLLIGNNIALVAFTTLMTIPLSHFLSSVLGLNSDLAILVLNTLLITAVVLVFGEFLPKVFFRLYADTILYTLAYPLWLIRVFLILPAKFTTWISRFILKNLLKLEVEETQDVLTRLDLEAFIKSSSTEADDSIDTEMFEKALNLREVRVGECMVPRPEIVAIDVNASIQELIDLFQESNLSRILVYEEDIDNVLGYVHHQQLLKKPKSIQSIVLEIPYVPEAMRVRDLLSFFVKNRQTIACVVDEFGGTAGLVTLEDVLEEIFGEIEDEH
ncbi:MAG: HlyC/CorC family transporter, partial [Bacteroidetes bacterium]